VNDAETLEQLVGQVFDKRYRIIEPLGKGGMGAVFRGEHVVIGRQVAIKVLHSTLGKSKDFASRFAREAIAAGRLDHPNCVPVTDSGQLDDGTAYMVMELVKGRSLANLLDTEGPRLEPVRALRIIRYVLRGLGHAHKVGIVHRDVKPDNVMLSERDENPDFARVLDFGIAKLRDADNKENEALTQAGMAVGTPTYLSPEQALGDEVDHRCDLYSVAVLLFEMLAGRPPFTAANPVGILTKHASTPPPALTEFAPELGQYPALEAIVQRGLAKSRDERYPDAEAFVAEIDAALLGLGSQLTPPPPDDSIADRAPTHPPAQSVRGSTDNREITGPSPQSTDPSLATAGTALAVPFTVEQTAVTPPKKPRGGGMRTPAMVAAAVSVLGIVLYLALGSGDSNSKPVSNDLVLQRYVEQLKEGATCKERLAAVNALRALKDPRAIPDLKKARKRMRGGTLGFNKKNANRCLRKQAQKTINELENL
jgi:serine/threonine-protein kinase